jgi:hypothetical protein
MAALIVGLAVCAVSVALQAVAVVAVVRLSASLLAERYVGVRFWADVVFMTALVLIVLASALAQVALWAVVFIGCGEFPHFWPAFYHSAVNFTSLGYGDVIMSDGWKLLGPLEAADGVLMFSLSGALLFSVMSRLIGHLLVDAHQNPPAGRATSIPGGKSNSPGDIR